jgi:hypothetical protein
MASILSRKVLTAAVGVIPLIVASVLILRETVAFQTAAAPAAQTQNASPPALDSNIDGNLDPKQETFVDVIPKQYNERPGWGLIVYIDSQDACAQLPAGWEAVLAQRKLLATIPQKAGNEQFISRRLGLAVLAANQMMAAHKIDPKRVYAAGLSGGARMAGMLGFYDPALFKGTIQSCGADFYEKVPQVARRSADDTPDDTYGLMHCTDDEIAAGKAGARFVFITGTHDFRHAAIVDIFHGGYEKAGFTAKLIDVPKMQHGPCGAKQLSAAIDFLEKPATATKPAAPAVPP